MSRWHVCDCATNAVGVRKHIAHIHTDHAPDDDADADAEDDANGGENENTSSVRALLATRPGVFFSHELLLGGCGWLAVGGVANRIGVGSVSVRGAVPQALAGGCARSPISSVHRWI